MDEEGLDFQDI